MSIVSNGLTTLVNLGFTDNPSTFSISSYNTDADVTEETIWNGTAARYVFPSDSGEAMQVVSDNAGDNQTLAIVCLDVNFREVVEIVTLNGTTPVALSQNLTRINSALNVDSTPFAGRVVVEDTGSNNEYCVLLASDQRCAQAIYTVPCGKRAKLEEVIASINETGLFGAHGLLNFYIRGQGGVQLKGLRLGISNNGTSSLVSTGTPIESFPEKTDLEVTTIMSEDNIDVSLRLAFIESLIS